MNTGFRFLSSTRQISSTPQRSSTQQRRFSVLAFATVMLMGLSATSQAQDYRVYFGTYTGGESRGIYTATFDVKTGQASEVSLAAETEQPSFIAITPDGRHLMAVNETVGEDGERSGGVSAFSIDAESGKLTFINRQPARGGAPCHLIVSPDGRHVLVANYVGGNVGAFPIDEDGSLAPASSVLNHVGSSVVQNRQEGPHAHSINLDPTAKYAIAADLGTDRLYVHEFNGETGELKARDDAALALPPGSGPRHFAWHPDGEHAFVINEITCMVTALQWNAQQATFSDLQSVTTLPDGDFPGNSTAEVVVHPSGRWVYGSNRGHDSIAIYTWEAQAEQLTPIGHQKTLGKTPRNFAVDPTGNFLFAANQSSGFVAVFRIDQENGALTEVGRIEVPQCVCVRFLPLDAPSE